MLILPSCRFLTRFLPLVITPAVVAIDGTIPPLDPVLDVVLLELDPESLDEDLTVVDTPVSYRWAPEALVLCCWSGDGLYITGADVEFLFERDATGTE